MDADGLPIVGPGINLAEVFLVSYLTVVFVSVLWCNNIRCGRSLAAFAVGMEQSTAFI